MSGSSQVLRAILFTIRHHAMFREGLATLLYSEDGVEDQRLKTLLAALGHALDFRTWLSLVHEQGLTDEQAIELVVGMVRSSMRD